MVSAVAAQAPPFLSSPPQLHGKPKTNSILNSHRHQTQPILTQGSQLSSRGQLTPQRQEAAGTVRTHKHLAKTYKEKQG